MLNLIYKIRYFFERNGFYVSSRMADRLGMRVKSIRLFFIYLSFATLGIGFALYLTLAFLLRLKDLVYTTRSSVFDLLPQSTVPRRALFFLFFLSRSIVFFNNVLDILGGKARLDADVEGNDSY